MNFHLGTELANPSTDFEHLQADCVKLGPGKLGLFQMKASEGVQQHIGHTMQKESELIGFKTGTRGSVGAQMIFMFLDHQFHCTSSAVDCLIDKATVGMGQIGHNKASV